MDEIKMHLTYKQLNMYISNRVNHETDIILKSDWFDELLEKKLNEILKKKNII